MHETAVGDGGDSCSEAGGIVLKATCSGLGVSFVLGRPSSLAGPSRSSISRPDSLDVALLFKLELGSIAIAATDRRSSVFAKWNS